jgi:hypothetical protein
MANLEVVIIRTRKIKTHGLIPLAAEGHREMGLSRLPVDKKRNHSYFDGHNCLKRPTRNIPI